jgi:hypothetical protein
MRVWTLKEVAFLEDNYSTTTTTEIADELGRSLSSVKNKAFAMGLKKGEEYEYPTRFARGGSPWNYARNAPNRGSFRKGRKPPNAQPEGAIRTDARGYKKMKQAGKWRYLPKNPISDAAVQP